MSEGGAALMAVGTAKGEDAARIAAEQAISSQLLDITIDGARGVLFNVTGGPSLTLFEVNQAAALIRETSHPDVNMIFGAVIDPDMGDEIRVTVIATGFERTGMPRRIVQPRQNMRSLDQMQSIERPLESVSVAAQNQSSQVEFRPQTLNTDDLDIPTFLRNRK
jgi:cell division protein FtsZ